MLTPSVACFTYNPGRDTGVWDMRGNGLCVLAFLPEKAVSTSGWHCRNAALEVYTRNSSTGTVRFLRPHPANPLSIGTTTLHVSEIAYAVGFSDPNYFSRVFHETFGYPPVEARRRE